eukprot:Polyplicarium_translucidae@DN1820_c0_g1_i1.p1
MSKSQFDRHITVFSPEGKLYQVEYAFVAVKSCAIVAFAVKGRDCVCLAVQKKVPMQQLQQDQLLDKEYVTSLHTISDGIGAVLVGFPADCRSVAYRSRRLVAEFAHENGYPMPVHHLALKVSNFNQLYTQHAYMRLLACSGMYIAYDEEAGPSIYKFDPAGWFAGCRAASIGSKEQEGTSTLEKLVERSKLDTPTEVVHTAVLALQNVLSADVKAEDLEIALVTADDRKFRQMTTKEIDDVLNAVAEKD